MFASLTWVGADVGGGDEKTALLYGQMDKMHYLCGSLAKQDIHKRRYLQSQKTRQNTKEYFTIAKDKTKYKGAFIQWQKTR